MSDSVSRQEFESLRQELAALRAQLRALEPGLSEDTLAIIAASVAAFVGPSTKVRFVRRAQDSDEPWRAHGRATVVAQHKISSLKGW